MNVSRRGYYTTEYIDHKVKGTPRSMPSPTSQHHSVRDDTSEQPSKHLRFDLPSATPSVVEIIAHPDDLPEDITPAQLNYLHKGQVQQERPRNSVSYDNYYKPSRQQQRHVDPDLLEDVASLTHTEEMFFDEKRPRQQPEPIEYKGYYIDQKKRFDEAEFVKPRMYTHKTFKDVFRSDIVEDRYNPIDLVFEDPQEIRELEQKRKLRRAVKNFSKRIGGNEYESYDYHAQQAMEEERIAAEKERQEKKAQKALEKARKKEKRKSLKLSLFPKKPTVRPEAEEKEEEEDVFVKVPDDDLNEEGAPVHNKKLQKVKEKLSQAKRQLEDNYFDNYNKNVEENELMKSNKAAVEAVERAETANDTPALGPNSNFNPVWNYLLSFLVYNQVNLQQSEPTEFEAPPNKIVEVVEPKTKKLRAVAIKDKSLAKKNKKKFNLQPYKQVFQNWNQPASAYLAGQRVPKKGDVVLNVQVEQYNTSFDQASDFPEEHVVLYDDDDEVDDELVFDPKSGTFLPRSRGASTMTKLPSFSSMNYSAPAQIILNVMGLIKSIGILRKIFAPIDIIGETFPGVQTVVILIELVIFLWLLYEVSRLVDALCMAVKAVCAPMIAIGKFMNRIV